MSKEEDDKAAAAAKAEAEAKAKAAAAAKPAAAPQAPAAAPAAAKPPAAPAAAPAAAQAPARTPITDAAKPPPAPPAATQQNPNAAKPATGPLSDVGSGQPIQSLRKRVPLRPDEKMVQVNVARAYMLTNDSGHEVTYAAGDQEMPYADAIHWWSKSHGGVTIKAAK